jgi:FkbM family methyltransferase
MCCRVSRDRNLPLSIKETLGLTTWYSQLGQDRWVLETVFPGVTDGFFVDVGSWEGTIDSNTKALEERGWRGICIDPFPKNMQDRTCRMFKEAVDSRAGNRVVFRTADALGGIDQYLGLWKGKAQTQESVELTTTTLAEILNRARAPSFVNFISLDIEGAELEALRGFPFDRYQIGTMAVEHNFEQPKRRDIEALMKAKGYRWVHSWHHDDYYVPAASTLQTLYPLWR